MNKRISAVIVVFLCCLLAVGAYADAASTSVIGYKLYYDANDDLYVAVDDYTQEMLFLKPATPDVISATNAATNTEVETAIETVPEAKKGTGCSVFLTILIAVVVSILVNIGVDWLRRFFTEYRRLFGHHQSYNDLYGHNTHARRKRKFRRKFTNDDSYDDFDDDSYMDDIEDDDDVCHFDPDEEDEDDHGFGIALKTLRRHAAEDRRHIDFGSSKKDDCEAEEADNDLTEEAEEETQEDIEEENKADTDADKES